MLDPEEIESIVAEYTQKYPPLLSIAQAAEIAHATSQAIYDESSRGDFDSFKIRRGKNKLLLRDPYIRHVLSKHETT